jgi:pimeloyl-ACP methyl ester carboxylesterase
MEFAGIFPLLAKKELCRKKRIWFIERPGHGISAPFDYFSVQDSADAHTSAYLDAVRKVAGVETMDVMGNSAGGWCIYCYAKQHPDRVKTFTWVGAPGCFHGQKLPFSFSLLGTWIGTQLMAHPPPTSAPSDLIFDTFNQDPAALGEIYVELYRALMNLRNTSLSFNYFLRVLFSNQSKYWIDLDKLKEDLNMPCHFLVGEGEKLITRDQIKVVEQQFGRPAAVIPLGGHLPWLNPRSRHGCHAWSFATDVVAAVPDYKLRRRCKTPSPGRNAWQYVHSLLGDRRLLRYST